MNPIRLLWYLLIADGFGCLSFPAVDDGFLTRFGIAPVGNPTLYAFCFITGTAFVLLAAFVPPPSPDPLTGREAPP